MDADRVRLTKGRTSFLIRLMAAISVIFAIAGVLLLLAPRPDATSPAEIAQATPRRFVNASIAFPRYGDLTSARATPFEFQELERTPAQVVAKPDEQAAAPPPPPPSPDVSGLTLIGAAPGKALQFAVLRDEQTGATIQLAPGDSIRNATVKAILPDKIVLSVGDEEADVPLIPVPGSDNLGRQLRGLPPLPDAQPAATPQPVPATAGMPPPTPGQPSTMAPQQSRGHAVLTGAAPVGGGPGTGGVLAMPAPSGGPSASAPAPGGSGPSGQGPGSRPGAPSSGTTPSQTPSPGTSSSPTSNVAAQTTTPPPASSGQTRRSLGISGHMLNLEKQQELGLRETGLLITSVNHPATTLQTNDVLLAIAGQSFTSLSEARNLIQSATGQTLAVRVHRDGTTMDLSAPLM